MNETGDIQELKELLSFPKSIVILTHRNPDGDAMGSSLALYNTLIQHGHKVQVLLPSEYPASFAWMPGADRCLVYDIDPDNSLSAIRQSEVIFCLDFNSLERVDKMAKTVEEQQAVKIMIDHHRDPEPFMDHMFSNPEASSTCEMLFDFIVDLGWKNYLGPDVIDCLYTGILTDTGSFRHATTARLYEIMAELKRRGLDDYRVNDLIFNTVSEKNLRLLGHSLLNRMEVLPGGKAAMIYLTRDDYNDYSIARGDTEGIVNYLLTLKGVQLAAFITEQPKIVKISLRSKYDVNVQKIAREHFNGGGHINASGGYTFESLDKAVKRLKRVISEEMGS